jgi:hypothetical protein
MALTSDAFLIAGSIQERGGLIAHLDELRRERSLAGLEVFLQVLVHKLEDQIQAPFTLDDIAQPFTRINH